MTQTVDLPKLERSLRWALANQLPQRELVAMLRPIVAHTCSRSENGELARLQLAEQLLQSEDPSKHAWEAAALTLGLLRSTTSAERRARANHALGLAYTVMGHYKAARRAYGRALHDAPDDPVAAHNLGHLLDVVFDRPRSALRWLALAHRELTNDAEVAASYARALCRSGELERARAVLRRAVPEAARVEQWLARWTA